jgi:hypothetical protein
MNNIRPSGRGRGMAIGVTVIAAGILVYLGVAGYLGGGQSVMPAPPVLPTNQHVGWRGWDSTTFADARNTFRLVLLLVVDEHRNESRAVQEAIEANAELRAWLASRLLPVRVDRRLRPDLADRYAEGTAPLAMLLLPAGEGLVVLQGPPGEWLDAITETDRYWREHSDELRERANDFWTQSHRTRNLLPLPATAVPDAIDIIDSAVEAYVENAIVNPDSGFGLWRVDISAYLRVRAATSKRAESLLVTLMRARANRQEALWDSTEFPGASAAPLFLDEFLFGQMRNDSDAIRTARDAASRLNSRPSVLFTASEAADLARLNLLLHINADCDYPGSWLGSQVPGDGVLPHQCGMRAELNGHLLDALAWLETFLSDPTLSTRAVELADSLWLNLWSQEAQGLRDKPVTPGPVRELENIPRAQLGRAASLFHRLGDRADGPLWFARADTCLSAFAPYVSQAGPAAAYYGIALLSLQMSTQGGVPGT